MELVAVLPLVGVVIALLWQATVAGQAVWLSGTAARAAARAQAIGTDPAAAARAALPSSLRAGVKARTDDDGTVRVSIRIPAIVATDHRVGTVTAQARFRSQR